ncbi:hypothetical protein JW899_02995 [Candidatus Uhrbacteria bacterium]|nr:hypothetical protein [Candidatus Uhrbacteria bacterium]
MYGDNLLAGLGILILAAAMAISGGICSLVSLARRHLAGKGGQKKDGLNR